MPPVGAAIAAIVTSVSAAVSAAAASGAAAGLLLTAFKNIAVGVVLSAIGRLVAGKQKIGGGAIQSGIRLTVTLGETAPQTIIVGRYATPGDLVYTNSFGEAEDVPNVHLVQVIELADWPATLRRMWVNGDWVSIATLTSREAGIERPGPEGAGYPVTQFRDERKGGRRDNMWVKFHDGTQTVADSYLRGAFGDDPDRPWQADMIGRGIPYAIVTSRLNEVLNRAKPEIRFELDGYQMYDRRLDSTAGGSGAHRFGNPDTWAQTDNPITIVAHIMRGLRDPVTDDFRWGGQGISEADLPASSWFTAANVCDVEIEKSSGGTEPRYRCGLEIQLSDDPMAVVEELLKTCQGKVADVGGPWLVRCGAPGSAVFSFTDDDVIVTSPDIFDPFPGMDETFNGVAASYPSPADGWRPRDARLRMSSAYLEEDKGKAKIAEVEFRAVPYRLQVQRLQLSLLRDGRRMRKHTLLLPPEGQPLAPLDVVEWTSERNGYSTKKFEVDLVEDLVDGTIALGLREVDPSDYDWTSDLELPDEDGFTGNPPSLPVPGDFSAEGAIYLDEASGSRWAAILLQWVVRDTVTAVKWEVRLKNAPTSQVGHKGDLSEAEAEAITDLLLMWPGEPVEMWTDDPIVMGTIDDEDSGRFLVWPVLPDTDHLVRMRYVRPGRRDPWCPWIEVHTPNVRIGEQDLETEILTKIEDGRLNALDARNLALQAQDRVNSIEATVGAISATVLESLAEVVDALAGIDSGSISELRNITIAGFRKGWLRDPTFAEWSGSVLTHWTGIGIDTYGSKLATGPFGTSLLVDIPAGTGQFSLRAQSNVGDQFTDVNLAAEYVIVAIRIKFLGGSVAGFRLRAEWSAPGDPASIRGDAFGQTATFGTAAEWDFAVDADKTYIREVMFKRPASIPTPDTVAVQCALKLTTPSNAIQARVDYLDIRPATDQEITAFLAGANAQTLIDALRLEITGPTGAIVAAQDTVRAEFLSADAIIQGTVVALASDVEAIAGSTTVLQASFGDWNLVGNPVFDLDATALAPGVLPRKWSMWPAGFSVVARNTGSAEPAVAAMPSRFAAQAAADALAYTARSFALFPCKLGDIFSGQLRVAAATGASSTFRVTVDWIAADGITVLASSTEAMVVNSTTWATWALADVTSVANTAYCNLSISRLAGGTGAGYFTGFEFRLADKVARARITNTEVVAASNTSAIATINTTINAEFGSLSAFVSQAATAVAMADFAASALVFRAVAGGGSAGIKMVAWDDETGAGGALLFDAENVIAPGTLSTGTLVVTNLYDNMVPDDQMQSVNVWGATWPEGPWRIIKDTTNTAFDSQGELRYDFSMGAGTSQFTDGADFPVRPGDKLQCSVQTDRVNGTTYKVNISLRMGTRDGTAISSPDIASTQTITTSATQTFTKVITVPSTARRARLRITAFRDGGADGDFRVGGARVVRINDASSLITPDGAFFDQLAAQEAWIGTANIKTANIVDLHIAPGAMGATLSASSFATGGVGNNQEVTVCSITIPSNRAGRMLAHASVGYGTNDDIFGDPTVTIRIRKNGSTQFSNSITHGGVEILRTVSYADVFTVASGDVVTLTLAKGSPGDLNRAFAVLTLLLLFKVT